MKQRIDPTVTAAPLVVRLAYAAGWVEGQPVNAVAKRMLVTALLDAAAVIFERQQGWR
jgi:hypothetical protein